MTSYVDGSRASNSQINFSNVSDMQESEIAYFIQNCQTGDPKIIEILVRNYAEEVHWLIQLLLSDRLGENPLTDIVHSILIQTFTHAVINIEQFWGEVSIRNWLYALAIHVTHSNTRHIGIPFPFGNKIRFGAEASQPIEFHEYRTTGLELLKEFSKKYRIVILLRFVFHLDINDIARILDVKVQKAHNWLTDIRRRLLRSGGLQADNQELGGLKAPNRETHRLFKSRIHAHLDGLIAKNSEEDTFLRNHLSICDNCKDYAVALDDLEGQLDKVLNDVEPRPQLSNAQLELFIQSIQEELPRSKRSLQIAGPLRKVISMALVTILIASSVFFLIRNTPERGEFLVVPTPTQRILPTPIGPNKSMISNEEPGEDFSITIYAIQPKISADGRWIVFASNAPRSEGGSVQDNLDIMIYDTRAQTLVRIASQVLPLDESLFPSPGISADGRWVVYNGYADAIDDGDNPCWTVNNSDCVDILLFDRKNNNQKRITHSYLGGPSNGDSILPVMSENGRWILFWSFASNLVDGDPEACIGDGRAVSCADLYIYDLINEEIEQVPIGRVNSLDREPVDTYGDIDISNDGRWLLIPILDSDRIADKAGLESAGGIFLYDREERLFVPINATFDAPEDNAMSFSGSMTSDGNYVVFHSGGSNPAFGDESNFDDVFLFDRSSGSVEIVSKAPDGTSGDGDSGIDLGLIGNLAITNDGRFVAFTSTAGNLDPESLSNCTPSENNPCVSIYVYDRITGGMENIAVPHTNSIHVYPTISDNGRWISYMEVHIDCDNANGICVDLNLYDRERGWTSEVTRNLYPREHIPWELETTLETTPSDTPGIEFSPDGEAIALFGTGRNVLIIDAIYGEERITLQGNSTAKILELTFSPDGRYVAGGASDGTVNIWRISDGSLAFILDEHPGRIIDIQYSTDGEYLYFSTHKAVWMWHRSDRKYTRVNFIEYSDVTIKDIDISPSNELMAMVPSQDSSIWIQRLPMGDVVHRLTGYGSVISSASFSPDGNYLVVQFGNGLMHVWQLEIDALGSITPILISEVNLPVPFGNIVFSPDGAFVATTSWSGGIQIIEIATGRSWTIPGSNNVRFASGAVFSPNGNTLAASSLGGGVYLWSRISAPDNVRWFTIAIADESNNIPNQRRPIQDTMANLDIDRMVRRGLTLYEAAVQTSFELFAPFRLPANVSFIESSIMQDGGVLVQYRVDDLLSGQPIGDLFFRQQEISGAIQPIRVGKSAVIEEIQFNRSWGEYVRGDWLNIPTQEPAGSEAQDVQNFHWTWSSTSDVQHMLWQHTSLLFSLIYIPRSSGELQTQSTATDPAMGLSRQVHLTKYDLLEIASGISNLYRSAASDKILTNYTVKSGDTCTSIALRYGTTVGTLVRLNKQIDNCWLIVEGQTLIVPLPNERLPLPEVDLDCDGKLERVRLVPTPLYVDPDISQGILLEVLSDIGLYERRWLYTVAEDAENIAQLRILPSTGCQYLLALNVIGLTVESDSGLRVFEWDAESMTLIFSADGWLQSVTPSGSGFSITTLELDLIPGTNTCDRITTIYTWDGKIFNETERFVEEGGSCLLE